MRIIAGSAGRKAIKVPASVTRPTTDFVRQAIFSILGERVVGARVLDLFAGSGGIGLESLSRGAAACVFVDSHRQAAAVIAANLAATRLPGGKVVRAECLPFLRRDGSTYDLVFADPPYWNSPGDSNHIRELLESGLLEMRLAPGGLFIAEVSSRFTPPRVPGLPLTDHRMYGGSAILIYRRAEP